MKPFLGKIRAKGWGRKGAPKGNARAAGRKQGRAFSYRHERHDDVPPPITRGRKREYLYANCVVLAAAIFAEPWAKQWAEDLLPAARQLDARALG
jgi:hypothetical protein